MCAFIAADEARHASAYMNFVERILEIDASEMILAFEDMMRKKIVMPAGFLRQSGQDKGDLYSHFSHAAQRIGVYTTQDYIDILSSLLDKWNIGKICRLSEGAEKAQDYLMNLPERLQRVSDRFKVPEKKFEFKWLNRS